MNVGHIFLLLALYCGVCCGSFVNVYRPAYRYYGYNRPYVYGFHVPRHHDSNTRYGVRNESSIYRPERRTVAPTPATKYLPQKNKCYACACTPDYDLYNMKRVAKQMDFPYAPRHLRKKTVYVTTFQKLDEKVGGWKPCFGPLSEGRAREAGIAMSHCAGTCYTRLDKNNNLFRGCFTGEYGVNPRQSGCHKQGPHGSTYCFCEGNLCNKQSLQNMEA